MKIVVCVKQVAVLGDEVEISEDGRSVDPDYLEWAVNEWDTFATEEALRIRDGAGGGEGAGEGAGEVVVITAGDDRAEEALRRCLAMGADRAVRVALDDAAQSDPLTVAGALAGPVAREHPDLVLAGVQSSDFAQSATGTALAELLGLPRVAVVTKLDYEPDRHRATVHRELEGGLLDVVEVDTPALLTIQTGINEPRYATLRAIKQAAQKELAVVPAESGGVSASYRVRSMFAPPRGERAELLEGSPAEVAGQIAQIVKERLA